MRYKTQSWGIFAAQVHRRLRHEGKVDLQTDSGSWICASGCWSSGSKGRRSQTYGSFALKFGNSWTGPSMAY